MPAAEPIRCDLAILGGGLAGGLIALALAEQRPEIDVRVVEAAGALGGNHVWSFFDSDIAAEDRWLVEPLIAHRWAGYEVAFPKHRRTLDAGYNSITSERFDAVVRERVGDRRIVEGEAVKFLPGTGRGTARRVVEGGWSQAPGRTPPSTGFAGPPPRPGEELSVALADGRTIVAKALIDARGPGDLSVLDLGWQKFVGVSFRVPGGHGLARPVVMDATVEQIDGYRFVYCLPFDAETVFVEDTYYSDGPALDVETIRARIAEYAAANGWRVTGVEREETGVLPVVVGGDFAAYWASTGEGVAKAGVRSGLFHPTTGYSLPDAVRLATRIAQEPYLSAAALARLTRDTAKLAWDKRGFYRMLDTMLFRAAYPHERYRIMERFYRLSPALIGRFYAARSTAIDKLRILTGKPPIPIPRALAAIIRNRG